METQETLNLEMLTERIKENPLFKDLPPNEIEELVNYFFDVAPHIVQDLVQELNENK